MRGRALRRASNRSRRLKQRSTPRGAKKRFSSRRTRSSLTKMKRTVFHLVYRDGTWIIKQAKSSLSFGKFTTKKQALIKARKLAKSKGLAQLVVHKRNNIIETEYTYGKDPRRYKG